MSAFVVLKRLEERIFRLLTIFGEFILDYLVFLSPFEVYSQYTVTFAIDL
jgi:hypothetical protein